MAARILIVEPDTPTLHLMAGLLAARGHTPLTLRAAPIDLVLCATPDAAALPALAAQLRADPLLGDAPLVAVVDPAQGEMAHASGFDGVIGKPVDPAQFATDIDAYLQPEASLTGTVLVVDDDPYMLELLADLLGAEGHKVLCAASPRAALALLAREPVAAVLSDQWMPEMNGTELLAEVARLAPHTARLVLSGNAMSDDILAARAAGAVDAAYTKPWTGADLREGLRAAFALHRARADKA